MEYPLIDCKVLKLRTSDLSMYLINDDNGIKHLDAFQVLIFDKNRNLSAQLWF